MSGDYTLHYDEASGQWIRVPYDSGSSSDAGASGWYSSQAAAAGLPNPQNQPGPQKQGIPAEAWFLGGLVLLALLLPRR